MGSGILETGTEIIIIVTDNYTKKNLTTLSRIRKVSVELVFRDDAINFHDK